MSKENILKDFLLSKDKEVADDVKKERFSIAYDVYEQFPKILREIGETFISQCISKINDDYKAQLQDWIIKEDYSYNAFRFIVYKKSWISTKNKPMYNLFLDMGTSKSITMGLARGIPTQITNQEIRQIFKANDYELGDWWLAYKSLEKLSFFEKDFLWDISFKASNQFLKKLESTTNIFKNHFDFITTSQIETLIDTAVEAYKNKQP